MLGKYWTWGDKEEIRWIRHVLCFCSRMNTKPKCLEEWRRIFCAIWFCILAGDNILHSLLLTDLQIIYRMKRKSWDKPVYNIWSKSVHPFGMKRRDDFSTRAEHCHLLVHLPGYEKIKLQSLLQILLLSVMVKWKKNVPHVFFQFSLISQEMLFSVLGNRMCEN